MLCQKCCSKGKSPLHCARVTRGQERTYCLACTREESLSCCSSGLRLPNPSRRAPLGPDTLRATPLAEASGPGSTLVARRVALRLCCHWSSEPRWPVSHRRHALCDTPPRQSSISATAPRTAHPLPHPLRRVRTANATIIIASVRRVCGRSSAEPAGPDHDLPRGSHLGPSPPQLMGAHPPAHC